jgi:hypothetical protein
MSDALKERGQAFEAEYFNRLEAEQLQKLKASLQKDQPEKIIADITGVRDEELLKALVDHDITPDQITALVLFPITYVGWADGNLDDKEKEAVIKAAQEHGIMAGTPAMELIESWTEQNPGEEMFKLWAHWVEELLPTFSENQARGLALNIISKVRSVANASRSFLGLGAKISDSEQEAIDKIERALGHTA